MTESELSPSKSEMIRSLLTLYGPEASPMRIVRELAEKGIVVTANLVSATKTGMFKGRNDRPAKAITTTDSKTSDRWDLVIKTKKLVDEVGSIDKVRDILALLEELKS